MKVILPGSETAVSRFIFGTANMSRLGSSQARIRVLDAACDHGITHFDTAPLYGFGLAERDIGEVLKRRPEASVTTKVGLYAPGGEDQGETSVLLRKAAGRLLPSLSRARADLSVSRARKSLEGSLRRLGRDHTEIFMVHEPDPELLATDEWFRWMEDETAAGRIGTWGYAIDTDRLGRFLHTEVQLPPIIQTIDSLDRREADCLTAAGRPLQITYAYVSAAFSRGDQHVDATAVLSGALARNAKGAVIVSTTRESRMAQFAHALENTA